TISWSADGATSTSISGLDSFTSTPINATYGAPASVSVAGIPTAPLTITLTAQNSDTSAQQQLTVPMITPQCTAVGGDAALHASPNASDQIVATIPQGTIVVVDAQDAQSQWLRVQLAGGAHGWGERTNFTCADNFSVDDLSKAITPTLQPAFTIVPTLSTGSPPTATPRPSATLVRPTTAPTFTPTHNPLATAAG
ncbi:MAG TPA: SH3 domain-containing protein, partial [Phototrophicaceae bacterium]|nr:SH3 domain-containing protein [Phototrophicaceae bacterium]